MPTNKEILFSSFCEMNISMLDLFVKEGKNEDDLSKEKAIEKLEELFAKYRKRGDTALIPHKGSCASDTCEHKGCSGYRFVGNVSKCHTPFVVIETETDWDDFFICHDFKSEEIQEELDEELIVLSYEDEKKNFVPTPGYTIKSRQCENALNELLKKEINYYSKRDYQYWLQQYMTLYDSLGTRSVDYKFFQLFSFTYFKIKYLAGYLTRDTEAAIALREFNRFNKVSEPDLLEWLVKYEELGTDHLCFILMDCNASEVEKIEGYFPADRDKRIMLLLSDYKNMIDFKEAFDEYYWSMLEKYQTISEEEHQKLDIESVEYKNHASLKYHLRKRGMDIPRNELRLF